jgi:uncharacterized sodium:solute symporter family permease YidK
MPRTFMGLVLFGVIAATLASSCAFVISYASYKNQFMDSRTPMRLALHSAAVTFVFFLVASLAAPWLFGTFLRGR